MVFPATPLPVRVDLQIGGAWTDATSDALARDQINITRGRPDEASHVDASNCKLSLKNQAGKWSPRNPLSPYFGTLGRNTPLRVGIGTPPAGAGTAGQSGTSIVAPSVTAESAGLQIALWAASPTGTITPPAGMTAQTAASGAVSTWRDATASVAAAGATGPATATYSPAATAAAAVNVVIHGSITATGIMGVGAGSGLTRSLAVTAGQYVLAFYGWSSDPYNRMQGAPADDLTTGGDWALIADTGASSGPRIKAYIRLVTKTGTANVAFFGDTLTTPDVYGRLWAFSGMTDWLQRFAGEVSEFPPRWDLSGKDVFTAIEGAGIQRRLSQGSTPLRSALFRELTKGASAVKTVAYWPLEDADGAASFASGLSGGKPMRFLGDGSTLQPYPALGADDGFAASDALPTFTDAGAIGSVPVYPISGNGDFTVGALVAIPASGMVDGTTLMTIATTGTIRSWWIRYSSASGGGFRVTALDDTGAFLSDVTLAGWTVPPPGARFWLYLSAGPSGADVTRTLGYVPIVGGLAGTLQIGTSTVTAQTAGRVTSVSVGSAQDLAAAVTFGHVTVGSTSTALFTGGVFSAIAGWNGEKAQDRFNRLCYEEGIPFHSQYPPTASAAMGPQRPAQLLDLFAECEAADAGVLYEPRGFVGLAFRTRTSKYNQAALLALSYSGGNVAEPFEPTDDDQLLRNDITVSRAGGSSARATQTTGSLSTAAPPAGVGLYDDQVTVNVYADADLPDQAAWRLHVGTWDEARYPRVAVDLAHDPALIGFVVGLDVGDALTVSGLPVWLPPGPAELLAEGFAETLGHPNDWDVVINASPAGPYRVAALDSQTYGRLDSTDSTLAVAASSGATTLTVVVAQGAAIGGGQTSPLWITTTTRPGDFPFDAAAAGEVVTVSAIANALTDSFTRTVSPGWGTADSGQSWTLTGTAANWATNGSRGSFTNGSAVNIEDVQEISGSWQDVDVNATVVFQTLPTGANVFAALWARRGTAAKVKVRLFYTTAGVINVDVLGTNATAILASQTSLFTGGLTGTPLKVRLQLVGTTIRVKVWNPTSSEPAKWTLEAADTTTPAAGGVAVSGVRQTGNTNVNPIIEYDDVAVTNPQVWTVTRAVNGVSKAQALGTQIRLAKPVAVAL